jgi:predicted Zn-dependent protease
VRYLAISTLVLATIASAQTSDLAEKARRARELVAAGRSEEAAALYQDLVNARPEDAGLRVNLSIALFKAKKYGEAAEQAGHALKLAPDLPTAQLFLGASRLELGQPGQALEPLRKAVAALPKDRNARLMLAQAALAEGRHAESAEHFRVVTDLMPDNPRAWYGLGQSLEALARETFADIEKSAPESAFHHALLGATLTAQRRYGSALRHYRDARAKEPGLRGVHAGMAAVYRETGHADRAAAEQEAEAKLPPPDCAARRLECDFAAGRYREVVEAAKAGPSPEGLYWAAKAYRLLAAEAYDWLGKLPPSPESHMLSARNFESRSLYAEAVREWKKALDLAPDDIRAQAGLANALIQARDYASALPLLKKLLAASPDSAGLRVLFGASLLGLEQPEEAAAQLEEALKLDPHYPPAHAALGQAYLRLGKAEQAIPHLEASLATDEDGSRRFQLARAYRMAGRAEEATRAMAEYQESRRTAAERARLEEKVEP